MMNSAHSNHELPGLYVHVPFCRAKCPYCDFYSTPSLSLVEAWLEGLRMEARFYADSFPTFNSLYFGGGTPTIISDQAFKELVYFLRGHFMFADDTEVTVEANPEDVTQEKLEALRSCGVNRLSIGVQSFDDKDLTTLKRRHAAHAAEAAVELARSAGFENISIDLIYMIPGQTEESWMNSLRRALSLRPAHLSCYQMTFEEGTSFGRAKAEGRIAVPDEETERNFFLLTSRFLQEHGFIHYEISNFARDEASRSRHNGKYWRHVPYLGLGPGAHSFDGATRWWNLRSVKGYCRALAEGSRPMEDSEVLTEEQFRLERLYLGMRTRDGISLADASIAPHPEAVLSSLEQSRLVRLENGRVLPTAEGFLVADRLPLLFPDR
ncbi:MAG TPA: radical SAM family heme chaperone HemW [Syntrophorhabdales bacterium]|nr:radical SAM family heme chaperone HemW [Syntrophorhabdales bacterium]